METANRRLMWHGMLLFLLGLFTGFAEPHFANVRMGLAAHLEGVMNGTLLLALGAIWPHVRLGRNGQAAAFWTALYSAYANWFFTTLAAVFARRRFAINVLHSSQAGLSDQFARSAGEVDWSQVAHRSPMWM